MPALREVQQVISRLRASLDDLNRLVETRDATIKDLRGELVLRIEELSQARADLADARRCGPLARAYEELSKLPSPAAIAAERLENTLQQDALRKQLARAEACNAGLRREVEGHLAALSRIAVKLDVPAQGQWQPIGERIDVLGGQIAALNLKLSLAEQENKLLAERLGIAYGREIDARRELADARILLDIALKQARQPAPAK